MIYHMARKHSKETARVVNECKICDKDFHSLHFLPVYRRKEHGAQRGSEAQSVNVAQLIADVDDNCLEEEIETCNHFLVYGEIEIGRHRLHNFVMDFLDRKYLLGKLNVMFDSLKCAAKVNVTFSSLLKNEEDASCWYYYAHENTTLLERSKLVATTEDLTKVKSLPSNTDVIESCKRQ